MHKLFQICDQDSDFSVLAQEFVNLILTSQFNMIQLFNPESLCGNKLEAYYMYVEVLNILIPQYTDTIIIVLSQLISNIDCNLVGSSSLLVDYKHNSGMTEYFKNIQKNYYKLYKYIFNLDNLTDHITEMFEENAEAISEDIIEIKHCYDSNCLLTSDSTERIPSTTFMYVQNVLNDKFYKRSPIRSKERLAALMEFRAQVMPQVKSARKLKN